MSYPQQPLSSPPETGYMMTPSAPPPSDAPPSYQQAIGDGAMVPKTPTTKYVEGVCPTCGGVTQTEFTCSGIILALLFFPLGMLCCIVMGVMQEEFTCSGIILALMFFPLGILCCFVMREPRCHTCRPFILNTQPAYTPVYFSNDNANQRYHEHHNHHQTPLHNHHSNHQTHHHGGHHHHHG